MDGQEFQRQLIDLFNKFHEGSEANINFKEMAIAGVMQTGPQTVDFVLRFLYEDKPVFDVTAIVDEVDEFYKSLNGEVSDEG